MSITGVDWAAQQMGLANLATGTDPVADYSPIMQRMLPGLTLIDDVYGGTATMRTAASRWLPIEPKERPLRYAMRINRTFLYNMFAKTVHTLAGKPFAKPIDTSKIEDEDVNAWIENIDLQGNHLDVFSAELMKAVVKDGIACYLVDMPKRPDIAFFSLYDAKQQNFRPFFSRIDIRNVLGWRTLQLSGVPVLVQLRIKECLFVPDGQYGERYVERVRVFNRGVDLVAGKTQINYEVWEKQQVAAGTTRSARYIQIEQGVLAGVNAIPFVVMYGSKKCGYMMAEPPLEDLAWLNVEHWQSSSDQKNILHVARVPILFAAGFPEFDPEDPTKKTPVEISPNQLVTSQDANAKLEYVEHTGASVNAGMNDLESIENRAALMGLQLLKKKAVLTTATEERQDGVNEDSELSRMTRSVEDGLEVGLSIAAQWYGKTGFEPEVTVFKDFSIDARKIEELTVLFQAREAREISQKTFLQALIKFELLNADFDIDAEIESTANEVPKGLGLGLGQPVPQNTPPLQRGGAPPRGPAPPAVPQS